MARGLWTPDGEVPIQEKDVVPITRRELSLLADLHEFAGRHKLIILCPKCDHSLTGHNNGTSRFPSVACQCREFRFTPA